MPLGISKKVYKEMVKEINIIASREESSQQQHELEVYRFHWFILLCKSNLILRWDINFQLFCCKNENKMKLIQHIGQGRKLLIAKFVSTYVFIFTN